MRIQLKIDDADYEASVIIQDMFKYFGSYGYNFYPSSSRKLCSTHVYEFSSWLI